MKFEIKGGPVRIHVDKFTKKMYSNLTAAWRSSGRAFVEAAVLNNTDIVLPSYTGQTRALFAALAAEFGLKGAVMGTIDLSRYIEDKRPDVGRSKAEGLDLGSNAYKLSYGSYKSVRLTFSWDPPDGLYRVFDTEGSYMNSHNGVWTYPKYGPFGLEATSPYQVGLIAGTAFEARLREEIKTVIPALTEWAEGVRPK